ncbi:uncharacterized protein stbd1 [Clinocottus analis]|uniref:uncharacterized protein stbd1 n=1 Tax=Clinocottus analis TaxID=304258 RepID=UPI0035BF123A
MPLKNGNTVAVERRVDLASLFCMIGRHGPAVALAVVAMVSVLAGLVIYRTVRGKRRKAAEAAAAGDGDGDGGSPDGAEGDASVMRERYRSAESTDVKDEGSSDVKEDVDLTQSDLRIRHRRAAAEKTPAPYSPPESIREPGIERIDAEEAARHAATTHVEEANRSDASMGDAVDCHPCESGKAIKGEEFADSCLKEPEPINADNHEQRDEVSAAEFQEDEGVTLEEDVLDETPRQEDNFQCALSDPVFFQQTSNMSENDNAEGPRDDKTTNSVIPTEDVPVPWFHYGKDEEFERENTDDIDFCSFSGSTRLSPEGESRNESEAAEEHRLDHLLIGEPAEIQSSTFKQQSNLPSVTDEGTPPLGDSEVEDGAADEGVVREDHWNKLEAPMVQFDERAVETEQKGGRVLACDQEVAEMADSSLGRQPMQKEDDTVPSLDDDTNSTTLGPQMPSHETEHLPDDMGDGTAVVLAEERVDQVLHHHVPSRCEDQQSIQTIKNESFDQASAAADPDSAANVPSGIVEDVCCPHLQSICQDQQSDHVENNDASGETRVDSAPDAAACNNGSCTALLMSEKLSSPDTRSSSQDQRRDQTKNHHEDFSEVIADPPLCQTDLPSLEQFARRGNDLPCVGGESGNSSMAASPDAGNECGVILENTVLPVINCDLKSEGQAEAQNSLFADDADIAVIDEDTAGTAFEPSHRSQPPRGEHASWSIYESFASSQDLFGHEIEHNYHRAMDQFATQIADSVTRFTEKQSDVKVVVVSKEEKKERSVEMKEEMEEDYEKTEISIMEATMDYNEWIMESNYQDFPEMNLSAPSFAADDTKSNQLPSEECKYISAGADAIDIPLTAEVKENGTLSLVAENIRSAAVDQPMAQNVDVTFSVHYFTQSPFQTVAVAGNQQELGNWKGFVPLEKAKDGHWATVVRLPAESHVEWKFVVVDNGQVCRWEECGNRLLHTGTGDKLLVHKCWARL